MNVIRVQPIFGTASFSLDRRLVFVLMPFDEDLTKIYEDIIKPTVESIPDLFCRRADDYKTNKAILQDIWKAICEARIVIADMTRKNPNVMYELGIAHTVGKDSILINQHDNTDNSFPFDLSHIRRIEYSNNAVGGNKLRMHLEQTIRNIIAGANLV